MTTRRSDIQNAFGFIARAFHFQRKHQGYDKYDLWHPPKVNYKDDTTLEDVEASMTSEVLDIPLKGILDSMNS